MGMRVNMADYSYQFSLKVAFGWTLRLISACENVSLQRSLLVLQRLRSRRAQSGVDCGGNDGAAAAVPFGHIYLEG